MRRQSLPTGDASGIVPRKSGGQPLIDFASERIRAIDGNVSLDHVVDDDDHSIDPDDLDRMRSFCAATVDDSRNDLQKKEVLPKRKSLVSKLFPIRRLSASMINAQTATKRSIFRRFSSNGYGDDDIARQKRSSWRSSVRQSLGISTCSASSALDSHEDFLQKRTLGIKHTPCRRGDRTAAVIKLVIDQQEPSSELELRPSDLLFKAREKIDNEGPDDMPLVFRFFYIDGGIVEVENEDFTRVSSCLDADGRLHICSNENMSADPFHLRTSQQILSGLSHDAESVVTCCIRLLEVFTSGKTTMNLADLPDPLDPCLFFFRDVARAVMSTPASCKVQWRGIEAHLLEIEKVLRFFLRRDNFVAFMSYHDDVKKISDNIASIQKELMRNSGLLDDHPAYFVRIARPKRTTESLLNVIALTNFIDLCGEMHAETRRRIAKYLGMEETEVIEKIKSKGVSNIFETGLFRGAGEQISSQDIYSTFRDGDTIKEILAPHYDSQKELITIKGASFNPRTCQWAMREFDEWSYSPGSDHECFLLIGGPASGKTTLVSHIIQERPNVVMASHFCRHDDEATTKPKVMLLSIVYQLCLQSVAFEMEIRRLLVNLRKTRKQLLSSTYPTATLFRDFLDAPLHSVEGNPDRFRCIIIDGIELGMEEGGKENGILQAFRNYLVYLPPWLRVVLTSRHNSSVIKRLRSFKARKVERDTTATREDFVSFFLDALNRAQYGRVSEREDIASTLSKTSCGNFVHATILVNKMISAQKANDISLFLPFIYLDFNQVLERGLELAIATNVNLFWILVRLLVVAFRALHKGDIMALTGCTREALELLLERSTTFLIVDATTIRFDQKLIKQWLLARLCHEKTGQNGNEKDSSKFSSTDVQFRDEMKSCHHTFSQLIMKTLESCKRGNYFSFTQATTKDYILQYGSRHLFRAGMESEAKSMLLDPTMLIERAADCDSIIDDMALFPENDECIALVRQALMLSKEALKIDPRQIASQLVGRLKAVANEDRANSFARQEVQAFVDKVENHDYAFDWWCPLSPTWTQAEKTLIKRMKGHTDQVQGVDMIIDSTRCASASWDGEVRIWNTLSGTCDAIFKGHIGGVWCVHSDCDGKNIVSGGADMTVRIWDLETNAPGWILRGHVDGVYSVKFSHDSKLIASGSKDGTIRIWDTNTGVCHQTVRAHEGFVYSVDWKPNSANHFICSGGTDNVVRIWDLASLACTRELKGHRDWVRSCCWSVDGRNVISGSSDQSVICWDEASGECDQVLMGASGGILSVCQSSDGRYVFAGSTDKTVKIWECASWRCDQTLSGHEGSILSISIARDGATLVTAGADGKLILWDCEAKRSSSGIDGHSKPIWGIDITPDSRYIVSASSDNTARLWDTSTKHVTKIFSGHCGPVWAAKFSHNSRYVATASSDTTASIFRLSTGGRKWTLSHGDAVFDVVWTPDDKAVFTACHDRVIRQWDAQTGLLEARYQGHTKDVKSLSLNISGTRLASASLDSKVRVWNLKEKRSERILQWKEAGAVSVDWVDDNVLVAGYTSGCVRLWNAESGERLVGFLPGHSRRTNAVSCNPNSTHIVSASSDKELRIWNIATEECERRITANTGLGVFCVKWTPDNKYILSGGSDRSIRMWLAENGHCESVFGGEAGIGIYEVSWSPCGKLVASCSCDRTVQIWDPDSGKCIKTFKGHTNWVHSVDWEKGSKRVLSRSDDETARLWNVESGKCEKVYNDALIPEDFDVGSLETPIVDLSGRARDGNPTGIQCQKVRVNGNRCCGWIGKDVYFFKLKQSSDLEKSKAQLYASIADDSFLFDTCTLKH